MTEQMYSNLKGNRSKESAANTGMRKKDTVYCQQQMLPREVKYAILSIRDRNQLWLMSNVYPKELFSYEQISEGGCEVKINFAKVYELPSEEIKKFRKICKCTFTKEGYGRIDLEIGLCNKRNYKRDDKNYVSKIFEILQKCI